MGLGGRGYEADVKRQIPGTVRFDEVLDDEAAKGEVYWIASIRRVYLVRGFLAGTHCWLFRRFPSSTESVEDFHVFN